MLTLEEIKELKKGDKITYYYKATFHHIDSSNWIYLESERGKIFFHAPDEFVNMSLGEIATETTPPKYDPRRKLKCGDIVELVEWNGRFPIPKSYFEDIDIKTFRVVAEECRGIVTIDICGQVHSIPICFIKLITPVEELNPYSVLETDTINGFDIMRDGLCVMTFPYGSKEAGYYRNKLAAKEAAEAERDRLNTEYRKEQEK